MPAARQGFLDQRLRVRPAANGANSLSDFADPLWVLLGGAGLVLLIACANLGNLLLARTTARVREVAVRLALGAGRGRLVRQLLTESLCLAVAGGICGLGLAFALRQALIRLLVDPIVLPATLDGRVLLFVFVLTLVVGLMLGLLPALRITKTPVAHRAARSGARHRRVRRVAADRRAWWWSASSPCRCRCSSAPACWRARSSTCSASTSGYPKDGLLTVRVDAQAAGYEPARQAQAFEDAAGARPRRARRARRHVLEQRAVRRLGQRRPDHASRATRRRAMAIAARATTPSAPATSRRSACR